MFNVTEIPDSFMWEIVVKVPYSSKAKRGKNKGSNSYREARCHVELAMLDDEETNRLLGVAVDDDDDLDDEQLDKRAQEADDADDGSLVDRILIGFGDDVMTGEGDKAKPLPFNAKNKALFLNHSIVRAAVLRGYLEAMAGQKAQGKN